MSDTPAEERDPLPVKPGRRAAADAGAAVSGAAVSGAADGGAVGMGAVEAGAVRARGPGRPAKRAEASGRAPARHRIGIRELRQQASVYVDLAEKGYTVDITNRGRLVAQLIPVREPGSPLERLIAAGIVEPAEEPGGVGDLEPYPSSGASGHSRSSGASGASGSSGASGRGGPR
jgi:antitoxin (DNA-binding transcriptional repressor) of toxin-antitoxin stability system